MVRETGGLYDSIKPFWLEGEEVHGIGFTFANYSAAELKERTEAAIALFDTPPVCKKLISQMMRTDFSWKCSAEKYLAMYEDVLA